MSQPSNPLTLEAAAGQLPALDEVPGDGIDVAGWLMDRAKFWPAPLQDEDAAILHLLCRRIAVRGKLYRCEQLDLPGRGTGPLLPRPYWALLIGVLLAEASIEPNDETARGTALKCLNAAWQALEQIDGADGVPGLDHLKARADLLTEQIAIRGSQ